MGLGRRVRSDRGGVGSPLPARGRGRILHLLQGCRHRFALVRHAEALGQQARPDPAVEQPGADDFQRAHCKPQLTRPGCQLSGRHVLGVVVHNPGDPRLLGEFGMMQPGKLARGVRHIE